MEPKVFDEPFAYICMNFKAGAYCSHCLRTPEKGNKLQLCGACEFARYCDKDCQRAAWKTHHKAECGRLKKAFPNLPLTEVLFLSRLTDRVLYLEKHGDTHNWQKDRKWSELLSHDAEIKEDVPKMAHFDTVYTKTQSFYGDEMPTKDAFFQIFCRAWINSHTIHTNAGHEVGMALDLGVSRYNHCCKPTCSLAFDGFRAMFRPLVPGVRFDDTTSAFIAYIDVGRSKYLRRKELKAKWYFDCMCTRCTDPDDDRLTAIRCPTVACDEALITTEIAEPVHICCSKCKNIAEPEYVRKAQEFMLSLPAKYDFSQDAEVVNQLKQKLLTARTILHPENIYYCRMLTAYMQMAPNDSEMASTDMHKLVYSNYKRCFPETDRHRGYQLLHLVKALIEQQRRDDAIQYAHEAMAIFEVCFGLDHPYYLQTLALWTFLSNKRKDKTDADLMQLMNFHYNRPVDISSVLQHNNLIPTAPNIPSHRTLHNANEKENGHHTEDDCVERL